MARAIEAKTLALRKLRLYSEVKRESAALGPDDGGGVDPEAVLARPAADLASPSVEWELRTGIRGFPWRDLEENSVQVDLSDWSPTGIDAQKLETVAAALLRDRNLRGVRVQGAELLLTEGWETREIKWDKSPAVQAAPEVAGLLILLCTGLTNLSLR